MPGYPGRHDLPAGAGELRGRFLPGCEDHGSCHEHHGQPTGRELTGSRRKTPAAALILRECESYLDFIRNIEYNVGEICRQGAKTMKYLSIRQTAERWGISTRRIQILCAEGRVPGAVRIDYSWAIPDDEPKPKDARIKSGKYIKQKTEMKENGNN